MCAWPLKPFDMTWRCTSGVALARGAVQALIKKNTCLTCFIKRPTGVPYLVRCAGSAPAAGSGSGALQRRQGGQQLGHHGRPGHLHRPAGPLQQLRNCCQAPRLRAQPCPQAAGAPDCGRQRLRPLQPSRSGGESRLLRCSAALAQSSLTSLPNNISPAPALPDGRLWRLRAPPAALCPRRWRTPAAPHPAGWRRTRPA